MRRARVSRRASISASPTTRAVQEPITIASLSPLQSREAPGLPLGYLPLPLAQRHSLCAITSHERLLSLPGCPESRRPAVSPLAQSKWRLRALSALPPWPESLPGLASYGSRLLPVSSICEAPSPTDASRNRYEHAKSVCASLT